VQVVHRLDVVELEQVTPDVIEVQPARYRLEQDVDGLAQQPHGARQDQHPDQDRDERVGPEPPGRGDHDGCHQHGDRAQGVVHHLEQGGPRVEAAALPAAQHEDGDGVAGEPYDAEHHHRAGPYLRWVQQPAHALDEDEHPDGQQHGGLERGSEHLGALVAPRAHGSGGAGHERGGDDRDQQARGVGQQVPCVGEQCEAAGHDGADHLDDQDDRRDGEHNDQPAPVCRGSAAPVPVPVPPFGCLPAHRRAPTEPSTDSTPQFCRTSLQICFRRGTDVGG